MIPQLHTKTVQLRGLLVYESPVNSPALIVFSQFWETSISDPTPDKAKMVRAVRYASYHVG